MDFLRVLEKIAYYAASNITVDELRDVGFFDIKHQGDLWPELTNEGFCLHFGQLGGYLGLYEFRGGIFYEAKGSHGYYSGLCVLRPHVARALYEEVVDYLLAQ